MSDATDAPGVRRARRSRSASGRGGGRRGAPGARGLLGGEEARQLDAVGRGQLLEAQARHLAGRADDARRAADHRAAREHEVEADDRADREAADAGADREAADADVARDELALLAERLAGLVELDDRGGKGDWQAGR